MGYYTSYIRNNKTFILNADLNTNFNKIFHKLQGLDGLGWCKIIMPCFVHLYDGHHFLQISKATYLPQQNIVYTVFL